MPTITKSVSVDVDVDVDIDAEDVLEELGDEELVAEARARGLGVFEVEAGDVSDQRRIDEAFLAAKALPECPRALRDLFWHVHGLAL